MAYSVTMKRNQKPRSGMALGGIGAGWFELRQDGTTANWNLFNNNPLGWAPLFPVLEFAPHSMLFFVAKWQRQGEEPRMKLLQIEESHGGGSLERHEIQYIFPWLTGVDAIKYQVRFPFARLRFTAEDMPFVVELEAWSPFIPFDERNSALPGAFLDFTVVAQDDKPVTVTLAACLRNAVAYDRPDRFYTAEAVDGAGFRSFVHSVGNVDPKHITFGSMGLTSLAPDSRCYLGWEHPHPYYERFLAEEELPEVNDVAGRNHVDKATGAKRIYCDRCWSTVAVTRRLAPGKRFAHSFIAAWDFPNQYARDLQDSDGDSAGKPGRRLEGHYYSNFLAGSAAVGAYLAAHRDDLKARSQAFVEAFYRSDAPAFVLDQVNSHLNTLFTSSWFSREGHFGIIEGLSPTQSYAGLSTTDVAMYGGVLYAALFPNLSRQVNRDYARFQNPDGSVAHSLPCNFGEMNEREGRSVRLDLPAQHAYMSLRDGFWSRDEAHLREMYPSARAAVEYALRERDPNRDGLPDMAGVMCSYDNFPMFGVSSFVAGQYILAFKALAEAAAILGLDDDAKRYAGLFENGRRIFQEKLWNGTYFRLCNDEGGKSGLIDEGCLSDQLISQWAAHSVGFGHMYDARKVRTALKSILKHNYRPWQGLRNCQWPGDRFFHPVGQDIWVDQANTCWTGVELEFAAFCLYEGLVDEGLKVVRNVDERYRRNGMYFDHQEFGGHYFRAMSAWSIIHALLGYAVRHGEHRFAPVLPGKDIRLLFVFDGGYGHFRRSLGKRREKLAIEVASGVFTPRALICEVRSPGQAQVSVRIGERTLAPEEFRAVRTGDTLRLEFPEPPCLTAGERLEMTLR
jgi:uncharacterized protein (DUF608 family)